MNPNARQSSLPRLCIVGPMVGRTHGYVTTQGERLTDLLEEEGFPVISVSTKTNRYARLFDIVRTLAARRRDMDLMLLQVFGGPSIVIEEAASWLASRFKVPIVMILRGGAMPTFMARYPGWNRRVLSRAAAIVTPSDFLEQAIRPYGYRAQVIPNIINIDRYPYRLRERIRPRILWMRAFHPIYNPQMAIRALNTVKQAHPDATMVMAGEEKGLGPVCRALAADLSLEGHIRFAGFLDMESKAREGDGADIYLNTNRIDNMPVSVVEAAAMGMPIVATAVGGVPYLLQDEVTGLLVPNEDENAAAEAILRLLRDPDLTRRLSAAGRELAERSAWENVRPQWLDLIDRVARQPVGQVVSTQKMS